MVFSHLRISLFWVIQSHPQSHIHQGNLLKLTYLQQDKELQVVVGRPVELQKIQGDSLVVLQMDQESPKFSTFSLGQAQQVRRIQGSIFASESTPFKL